MASNHSISASLEGFTHAFAGWAGSSGGFLTASLSIVGWFVAGEIFHFSNRWENALSVYIGVITFLMLFLVQRSQRKELLALHVKLNELIASSRDADNRVINIEDRTEDDIAALHQQHDAQTLPARTD